MSDPKGKTRQQLIEELEALHNRVAELETIQRQTEEALRESEERYRTLLELVEHSPIGIYVADDDFHFVYANQKLADLTGYSTAELKDGDFRAFIVAEDVALLMDALSRRRRGEEAPGHFQIGVVRKDGQKRRFEVDLATVFPDGEPRTWGQILCVTEQSLVEEALVKERQLLRAVIDHLPDNIFAIDGDGKFILNNAESIRILGASRQEDLIGKSDFDFFPHEQAARWLSINQTILKGGRPVLNVELFQPENSDQRRWISASLIPLHDESGTAIGLVGILRDISERIRTEEAMRLSEQAYRLDLQQQLARRQQSEEALQISVQNTRHFQEQLRTLLEVGMELDSATSVDELCRMAVELGRSRLGFDRLGVWLYEQNNTVACGTYGTDEHGLTRDEHNEIIPVAEYGRKEHVGDPFGLIEKLASGEQQIVMHESAPIPSISGTIIGTGWSAQVNMWDGQRPVGHLSADNLIHQQPVGPYQLDLLSLYAITLGHLYTRQRTDAQILALNAELEQRVLDRTAALQEANERLQSLSRIKDEFVSNVSHELRTPITSLKLRQYLVRAYPDQLEAHLQVMERETERLHRTIEDLLQLSRLDQRQTEFQLTPLTINALIGVYVADRVLTAQAKGLTLVFEETQNLPMVLADKSLLEQTLAILLTNAINYTLSGGHITVKTLVRHTAGQTQVGFGVTDTGLGISPADQRRLFERFFRGASARASGAAGTGLGLAIAREIIDRHSGWIEVESSGVPGQGTRFTVWLPAHSIQVDIAVSTPA